MVREKHVLLFLAALLNVLLALACLILLGQRRDARRMWYDFRYGVPEESGDR